MYEVKVTFEFDNVRRTVTLATFDDAGEVPNYARGKAIAFAKQIAEYDVKVIYVPDEDNPEKAFGLVYARLPERVGP